MDTPSTEIFQRSCAGARAIDLFEPEVVGRLASVHTSRWEAPLLPEEAALADGAPPKRQRELLVGRSLARLLLAQLGIAPTPLLRDPDRCPIWPENTVGSISHSSELCAVVVTGSSRYRSLGVDVESDQGLEPKLRDRVCLPSEVDGLDAKTASRRAKLLFSIKEAVYKCQFPISRTRLGFHDVEVEIDSERRHFRARLHVESAANCAAPIIQGDYAWHDSHVVCLAKLPV